MPSGPRRWAGTALAVGATAWFLLLPVVAWARHADVAPGTRGAASVFHAACAHLCHQQPSRSWRVRGVSWPVCARCAGLYAGAAAGAWIAALGAWRPRSIRGAVRRAESLRVAVAAAAGPTAVTWAVERAGWLGFSNGMRFWLALPLGAVGAWIVASMLTGRVE